MSLELAVWFASILVTFIFGLEIGRWDKRLYRDFFQATVDVLRERSGTKKPAPALPQSKPRSSPGVVVPRRTPDPIDLEEATGPVMPLSPMQVAAEEDARRKRGE